MGLGAQLVKTVGCVCVRGLKFLGLRAYIWDWKLRALRVPLSVRGFGLAWFAFLGTQHARHFGRSFGRSKCKRLQRKTMCMPSIHGSGGSTIANLGNVKTQASLYYIYI